MPPRKDNLEKRIKRFQQIDEEKIPEMLKTVETLGNKCRNNLK